MTFRGKVRGAGYAGSLCQERTKRSMGTVLAITFAGMLSVTFAPRRGYALQTCHAEITACCKITKTGTYVVSATVTAKGSYNACIKIKAPNVTLNGINFSVVSGPGAGSSMTGLLDAAAHTTVSGVSFQKFTVGAELDGKDDTVSGCTSHDNRIGVLINGANARITNVEANFNKKNGIVINAPAFFGFGDQAADNRLNGMVFRASAIGSFLEQSDADGNGKTGIKLNEVTSGFLGLISADYNGTYGAWLRGASGVNVFDFEADANTIAGVYLGCHGNGPSANPCPWGVPSAGGNFLQSYINKSSEALGEGAQKYGVAVDIGSHANRIFWTTMTGNSTWDAYDGNPNCGNDRWAFNTLGQVNKPCIK